MARLYQSGFELNSTTAGVEFSSITGTSTIDATTFRTGSYAGKVNPSASTAFFSSQFLSSNSSNSCYIRAYIYFTAFPAADCYILRFLNTNATTSSMGIRFVNATSKLRLADSTNAAIGSDSSALSLNTWYMVELMQNDTTTTAEARLEGASFAFSSSVTAANINPIGSVRFGISGTSTTGTIFYDDLAINDTTGSFQTSWPGSGKIVHVQPNAAGDANSFSVQVGGTAGSANNYTRVNEITPDDASSYNASNTLNQEDLFTVGSSGVGASDTVNVVAVGLRYANVTGVDTTTSIKAEIEKTSGGTITQSAALDPDSTTWVTNNNSTIPAPYALTTYQDPDGAAWTNTTLGTMQIGYKLTTAHTNPVAVSTIWASIDYTPGAAPGGTNSNFLAFM